MVSNLSLPIIKLHSKFESSVKLVWSPIGRKTTVNTGRFESSVKLVWSPIDVLVDFAVYMFESSVKLVWSPIAL